MHAVFMPATVWAGWLFSPGTLLLIPGVIGMLFLREIEHRRTLGSAEASPRAEGAKVDFEALVVRLSFIDAMESCAAYPVERAHEYWCKAQAIVDAAHGLSEAQVDSLVCRYIDGLSEGVCGIAFADSVACIVSGEGVGVPERVLMAIGAIGRRHGNLIRALCPAAGDAGQDIRRQAMVP